MPLHFSVITKYIEAKYKQLKKEKIQFTSCNTYSQTIRESWVNYVFRLNLLTFKNLNHIPV